MKITRLISLFLVFVMLFSMCFVACESEEAGKYNDAKALYEAGKYEEAQTAFENIQDYEDSKDWVKKCKTAILDGKYNDAVKLLNDGKIIEAYEALVALNGHKDSADKAAGLADQYKAEKLKNAKVGDTVIFGRYEQDNVLDNGAEDIEWTVLDVKDGKALLISKYILDFKKYKEKSPFTWEKSEAKSFLNGPFLSDAFNMEEADKIKMSDLAPDMTEEHSVLKAASKAKVFLLNITEVENYFRMPIDRKCEMTAFAKTKCAMPPEKSNVYEWLLRVVDAEQSYPYAVSMAGDIIAHKGRLVNGIRPAMWIELGA